MHRFERLHVPFESRLLRFVQLLLHVARQVLVRVFVFIRHRIQIQLRFLPTGQLRDDLARRRRCEFRHERDIRLAAFGQGYLERVLGGIRMVDDLLGPGYALFENVRLLRGRTPYRDSRLLRLCFRHGPLVIHFEPALRPDVAAQKREIPRIVDKSVFLHERIVCGIQFAAEPFDVVRPCSFREIQREDAVPEIEHPLETGISVLPELLSPIRLLYRLHLGVERPLKRVPLLFQRIEDRVDGRFRPSRTGQLFAIGLVRDGRNRLEEIERFVESLSFRRRLLHIGEDFEDSLPFGRLILPERIGGDLLDHGVSRRVVHVPPHDLPLVVEQHPADGDIARRKHRGGQIPVGVRRFQNPGEVREISGDQIVDRLSEIPAVALDGIFPFFVAACVHFAAHRRIAEDVRRMLLIVPVDADAVFQLPVDIQPRRRLVGPFAGAQLLKKHHVRDDARPRVRLECVVRQPERSEEPEALREKLPRFRVRRIEEPMRHDHRHHAARAEVRPSLRDDVVVDLHSVQMFQPGIVPDERHASERRVSYRQVERALREIRMLESRRSQDVRRGIERRSELARDRIDLRRVPFRRRSEIRRFEPYEIPGPDGRFEHPAAAESHVPDDAPHCIDDALCRIVRIRHGLGRGVVFLFREDLAQLRLRPTVHVRRALLLDVEHGLEPAPSDIPRHDGLFLARRVTVFLLQCPEGPYRRQVAGYLLAVRSLAESEGFRDNKIAGVLPGNL